MKTYILDTFNRFKRYSDSLDIKTVLCNKSWWVFNDLGEKEIYLFQEDNTLIIAVKGIVSNATWKYISANNSLLISTKSESYLLHPAFIDEVIFALQLDGTSQYSFMIDETQRDSFAPKTLTDITNYFHDKESKQLKAALIETVRIEREKKEQRQQELAEKERDERLIQLSKERNNVLANDDYYKKLQRKGNLIETLMGLIVVVSALAILVVFIIFYSEIAAESRFPEWLGAFGGFLNWLLFGVMGWWVAIFPFILIHILLDGSNNDKIKSIQKKTWDSLLKESDYEKCPKCSCNSVPPKQVNFSCFSYKCPQCGYYSFRNVVIKGPYYSPR